MQPIAPLLLSLVIVASSDATQDVSCTRHRLGLAELPSGIRIKNFTTTYTMTETDEQLYIPIIPQREHTWLSAKVTVCNPAGHKPFVLGNSNTTAEIHCTYEDEPRCPHGLEVEIVESYSDGPRILSFH